MKVLFIGLFVCLSTLAKSQETTFVGQSRERIREAISKSNYIKLSQSGVSFAGDKFDSFELKNAHFMLICYYDETLICKAYKEVLEEKRYNTEVSDLQERYIKITDSTFVNREKTIHVRLTTDQGLRVIEYMGIKK